MACILIIEDELPIRRFLRASLRSQHFTVLEAATASEGLQLAAQQQPDVVILDLGLPDFDGLTVIERLREWSTVPIIILSARGQEHDKVQALDSGADDYLTKPFGMSELMARMRVALRHTAQHSTASATPVVEFGAIRVDRSRRQVWAADAEVHLTPNEYGLLSTLIEHAGKVLTHRQLLKAVWGPAYTNEHHYVRVYMRQLRNKLEADPARPQFFLTEPGVGYRLELEPGG